MTRIDTLLKPHPIHGLLGALVWNYVRHVRGQSTICSSTRPWVGPVAFTFGWGVLTGWLWTHYTRAAKFHKKPWLP